jgi:hypothetical protein
LRRGAISQTCGTDRGCFAHALDQQNAELHARLGGTSGALSVLAEIGGEYGFAPGAFHVAVREAGVDIANQAGLIQVAQCLKGSPQPSPEHCRDQLSEATTAVPEAAPPASVDSLCDIVAAGYSGHPEARPQVWAACATPRIRAAFQEVVDLTPRARAAGMPAGGRDSPGRVRRNPNSPRTGSRELHRAGRESHRGRHSSPTK